MSSIFLNYTRGLRFFITYLIEQDVIAPEPEPNNQATNSYEIVYEGIGITEDEIPF